MSGAGNPLTYDYRDPRHVVRYGKLVVRNPDGSTEGKHPRDADVDVMREIHDPAPLLRVIRAKCLDCSAGVESEIRKCTAIGCALWPYRMATNPFRAPREMTPEQREAGAARLAVARARGRQASGTAAPAAEHGNYQGKNEPDASDEEWSVPAPGDDPTSNLQSRIPEALPGVETVRVALGHKGRFERD
jgi:hypothetical protein